MTDNQIIELIYKTLDEKKANRVKVLDISNISIMSDYMVVASAGNINHVHALAEYIEDELRKIGLHYTHMEGYKSGNWILMDYGNIVIHIFDESSREFYDLEHVWADGKAVAGMA